MGVPPSRCSGPAKPIHSSFDLPNYSGETSAVTPEPRGCHHRLRAHSIGERASLGGWHGLWKEDGKQHKPRHRQPHNRSQHQLELEGLPPMYHILDHHGRHCSRNNRHKEI